MKCLNKLRCLSKIQPNVKEPEEDVSYLILDYAIALL